MFRRLIKGDRGRFQESTPVPLSPPLKHQAKVAKATKVRAIIDSRFVCSGRDRTLGGVVRQYPVVAAPLVWQQQTLQIERADLFDQFHVDMGWAVAGDVDLDLDPAGHIT